MVTQPSNNDDLTTISVNALRARMGLRPVGTEHKRHTHSVTVSDEAWEGLRNLSSKYGFNALGRGGNISGLVEAIGQGLFSIDPKEAWELDDNPPKR